MEIPKHWIKITTALIAVIVAAVIWFIPEDSYEIKNYPSAGETIVAFGDSLVEGVGSSAGHDFVSLLSEKIGVPIVNAGRSGDTTSMALQRLGSDVLSRDPDIVLVLLGGNDYLEGVAKSETFGNLNLIIDRIQEEGAIVAILAIQGGLFQDDYRGSFTRLAEEKGAAYVPNVLRGIIGRADLLSDSVHPNDKGYKIMADRIEPVLQDLLPIKVLQR
ncbi:MAG: GDSL-type esterase/lipase family protein [Patescibacteria group bacterium]|nr:GDSL-type esterase/lipase family protein [Patescibacteria group bacterium]